MANHHIIINYSLHLLVKWEVVSPNSRGVLMQGGFPRGSMSPPNWAADLTGPPIYIIYTGIYICNELGVCQGPISHNNEQTQSVEGII